jgi:tetratricopeptide (TPR) repeat protein
MVQEEINHLIHLAQVSRNQGRREEALDHYKKALAIEPSHVSLPAYIASELMHLGRFDEGIKILDALLERIPNSVHALNGLAQIARKQGKRLEAICYFQKCLELEPKHPTHPVAIAVELRELGRFEEALSILEDHSEQLDPSLMWQHKGLIFLAQANHEEAMRCYEFGISASPTDPRCYEAMVSELIKFGLHKRAQEVIERAEVSVTRSNFLYLYKIRALISQGLYERAISSCQHELETHPQNWIILHHLIDLNIRTGHFNQAEELLNNVSPSSLDEEQSFMRQRSELAKARFDLPLAWELALAGFQFNVHNLSYKSYLALIELVMGKVTFAKETLADLQAQVPKEAYRKIWPSALGNIQGRLYSEMRTNPFAQKLVAEAWQVSDDRQRIEAMARALDCEPSYIGTAMSLLSELRRQGAFKASAFDNLALEALSVSKIPKRIIQFWNEALRPDDIIQIMQSWDRTNPDFEHVVFDDAAAETFILEHFDARVLRAFRSANYPAMRADIFRLAYLAIHGGVYADADDLCRHPITTWLAPDLELILIQEHLGSIGNNFIASIPNHPFILAVLEKVVDQILDKQGDIWFTSGPGAWTILFCNYYLDDLRQSKVPLGIAVIDCYSLSTKISIQLPRQYKQTSKSWSSPKNQKMSIYRIPNSFIREES